MKMRFSEFIELRRGCDLPTAKRVNGHYPVISANGINGYHNKYLNKYQKKRAKFLYQKRFKEYFYRYTIKRILKTKLRDIMPASIYYLCSQIKKGL